jgi:predicted nucleic acid-binding protein
MKDKRTFFDTSAIVPLIIRQATTLTARQLAKHYPKPVVAWTAVIEVHSALARLTREGNLGNKGAQAARDRLNLLSQVWAEILMTSQLRESAIDLLAKYDLRAADAIQLASALVWCNGRPRRRAFITFDERLSAAAVEAGFESPALAP